MLTDPNARLYNILDFHAANTPDAIGWVDETGAEITFAQMQSLVLETTAWMRDAGVVAGDRVMLVGENCIELLAAMLAIWHVDAWAMPVNARLSAGEIDRLACHATPKMIIFTSAVSKEAAAHGARHQADGRGNLVFAVEDGAVAEETHPEASKQTAALMYTTGTTGNPKGVMLSHASLGWYAALTKDFRHLTPDDHTYCALPMTHIFGLGSAFLGNMYAGNRLEFASRFDPAAMLEAIERGVTVIPAVPAMYAHLLDCAEARGIENLHGRKLRYVMTGGAPLDPDWKRRVEGFLNLPLYNGYGMTECAPGISSSKNMEIETSADDISCGQALPGLDVKVVPAPDKSELAEGVGEIVVKGPNIMLGYYKNAAETAAVMDDAGYFHTGDLGRIDEGGKLFVVGRCKELIIRSGFNVYPPEVEASLTQHPAVTLAAVVGRAEAGGNEEVLAFVQNVPGVDVTEQELKEAIAVDLAPYKRPSRIIVSEALPVSSTGKILKSKLIETFSDQLEQS